MIRTSLRHSWRRKEIDNVLTVLLAVVVLESLAVVVRELLPFEDNSRQRTVMDHQERRFRSLVQHASDITMVTDDQGMITYASPATNRVLGIAPADLVGRNLGDLTHPDDQSDLDSTVAALVSAPGTTITIQLRARYVDASWRWLEVVGNNLLDDPSVGGIIYNAWDVTEARLIQQRLRHDATHDPLTRLANRALFDERRRAAATADSADIDDSVGVLVIDLDGFKTVNDTLGHQVGDRLLTIVAKRLLSCVRPEDTPARLGGDEFAVLLPTASASDVVSVAMRILDLLGEPVFIDSHQLCIRGSIGVAVGPRAAADSLLRISDEAMYEAKRKGAGIVLRALPSSGFWE